MKTDQMFVRALVRLINHQDRKNKNSNQWTRKNKMMNKMMTTEFENKCLISLVFKILIKFKR